MTLEKPGGISVRYCSSSAGVHPSSRPCYLSAITEVSTSLAQASCPLLDPSMLAVGVLARPSRSSAWLAAERVRQKRAGCSNGREAAAATAAETLAPAVAASGAGAHGTPTAPGCRSAAAEIGVRHTPLRPSSHATELGAERG